MEQQYRRLPKDEDIHTAPPTGAGKGSPLHHARAPCFIVLVFMSVVMVLASNMPSPPHISGYMQLPAVASGALSGKMTSVMNHTLLVGSNKSGSALPKHAEILDKISTAPISVGQPGNILLTAPADNTQIKGIIVNNQ